jgi:hypothetical protein
VSTARQFASVGAADNLFAADASDQTIFKFTPADGTGVVLQVPAKLPANCSEKVSRE